MQASSSQCLKQGWRASQGGLLRTAPAEVGWEWGEGWGPNCRVLHLGTDRVTVLVIRARSVFMLCVCDCTCVCT